jgi:two-component system sensor histidine kinase MprB
VIFAPQREQPRRQRISLRTRVTLLAAISVAGTVALVSLGAYITVSNNLYSTLSQNLVERAESALRTPSMGTGGGGTSVPALAQALSDIRYTLIDNDGDPITDFGQLKPSVTKTELDVASGRTPSSVRDDSRTDSRVYAVGIQIGRQGNSPIQGALVLSQSFEPTRKLLRQLALVLVLISGAGVILAALAGTAVARTGLSPVDRLTRATARVARTGDLRPIPVTGDDELARLTQNFNSMLTAVAEARDRQRNLVADAGHELRTPLTSLRTNLELLMASEKPGAPTLSDQDKSEIQIDLRAQLDELTTLIGDLVELAREEAAHAVWEPVELIEVVEQALDRARRRAGEIQFDVALQPWRLIGDAPALERAVLNLLDNAVKFSPQGSAVRVRLTTSQDGFALLEVADQGQGIDDEDLPRVFDRFYRSQEARTLPGSGLGLAIVQQAAIRHGGEVVAGRAPEGGALFIMRLPGMPG